ncbi:hypothetical protein EV193_107290 [Herbihabitans rhizosphaerae]|uniref:Uncharacterized protein n=1 Tax=Herbihabitans rhizosphaerae TaxID=1872711 RepID=A0A4Q7KJ79_9PSEU|nr:hypothetical protein [Herbihabitans rhizosphaerae]RZS36609.1 hypothetical protein EV193_107290 [Herbihabitans rhizosphaerae]
MNTTPWWGAGLFTLAGTLVGALATLSLGLLNRRSERRRLSRDDKAATYPALVGAATRLGNLPVWPDQDDPHTLHREVDDLAQKVAFLGPRKVAATVGPLLTTARTLADTIVRIRTDSRPGHGDKIDRRLAPEHRAAVEELARAVERFAAAGRADLEIRGDYAHLINMTESSRREIIDQRSREPGAGSREPGAGSREPGAGSREPGAGSREPGS